MNINNKLLQSSVFILMLSFLITEDARARTGLSFSYSDQMQTQLVCDFHKYQLMPGIGLTYGTGIRKLSLLIDNNFKIGQINKIFPFFGIGLKLDLSREILFVPYIGDKFETKSNYYLEPNFGLQYKINDNIFIFGDVRLSTTYDTHDGFYAAFGGTVIGIGLCR
jgi:outer membrane protein W